MVGRFTDTKTPPPLTTPELFELALACGIDQGQLRRHADRIRVRLDGARARTVKLALAHDCTFASEPAGLFGWVDTGVDTDALTYFPNREELLRNFAQRAPAAPVLRAEDVANAVYLLCLPEAAMINGHTLVVDGGFCISG